MAIPGGERFMTHRCGFNQAALVATLEAVSFAQVVALSRPERFDLWALASLETWPAMAFNEAALTLLPHPADA